MVRIAAAAVAAALCCAVVRRQTPELALALAVAGGGLLLSLAAPALEYVVGFLTGLADSSGLSAAVLSPVLKVTGISLVTRTAGELCRDAKEGGLAAFVELAGTVTALAVTLPLAQAVLATVSGLIGGGAG